MATLPKRITKVSSASIDKCLCGKSWMCWAGDGEARESPQQSGVDLFDEFELPSPVQTSFTSTDHLRWGNQETQRLLAEAPPGIEAIPHDDNLRFFDVTITGPDSSPYAGPYPLFMSGSTSAS